MDARLVPSGIRACSNQVAVVVLLNSFSGPEMAGTCSLGEYHILLEENNFTDLTFGEKENSEQEPTVRIKQPSCASPSECAGVIFQSCWPFLAEWDSS